MKFYVTIKMINKRFFTAEYIYLNQTYTFEIAIIEKNKHWEIDDMIEVEMKIFS